jgi:hypothetical protein
MTGNVVKRVAEIVSRRDASVRLVLEGDCEEYVLPLSQIELYSGDTLVSIPRWLAEDRGIE